MRLFFTILLWLLSFTGFSQTWELTPDYIKIPSVSTLPDCIAGRTVFKIPENKLYTCDGSTWRPLQVVQQEGFTAQAYCCQPYPNFPSVVDFKEAEVSFGSGGFSSVYDSYTVPVTGLYSVSASFTSSSSASTPGSTFFMTIYLVKNGEVVRMHVQNNLVSTSNATAQLTDMLLFKAGDVIQIKIAHNYSAAGGLIPNNLGSYLSIFKIY
ncbi:MAG: hypothetical protein BGO59_28625 [Spirosoma sp. 48-14]|nr:MAG: hypothetical protein BGO59_28625 [Spirosoma sp. 48-14]